jgi:hypothetical protein
MWSRKLFVGLLVWSTLKELARLIGPDFGMADYSNEATGVFVTL